MGEIECDHERTFSIHGKASDRFSWSYNDGDWSDPDYAPEIEGLCGGDDIEIKVCLQCHTLIGFCSDDVDDLVAELEDEELELDEESDEEDDLDFDEEE